MKTKISLVLALMLFSITSIIAQEVKTETFKVYGNCGMCESRIEKAAISVDGVSVAEWNKETKKIEVTFDSDKVKLQDIQKAIVKVGHDTDNLLAEDDVYNSLPGCCKYERKEIE